jgi:hypothetical protein
VALAVVGAAPPLGAQEGKDPLDAQEGKDTNDEIPAMQFRRDQAVELFADVKLTPLESIGSLDSIKGRWIQALSKRIASIDQEYYLTDAQKKRLFVAGQGDIKRALDRMQAVEGRPDAASDLARALLRLNNEANLAGDLESDIFGRGSLLTKVMTTTLTDEQRRAAYERRRKEQRARYRATVADVAASLAPALGLTDERRQKLESLLLQEIRAPRELGESNRAYIMYHFLGLPEAKIRSILDDTQWRRLAGVRRYWESRPSGWSKAGVEGVDEPAKSAHTRKLDRRE